MPHEQELLDSLAEVEKELSDARRTLADAKKRWTEAETKVIDAKLRKEKLAEALRVLRAQQVVEGEDYALYDDEDSGR